MVKAGGAEAAGSSRRSSHKTLIDLLPDRAPKVLLGDKSDDTDAIRVDLRKRRIKGCHSTQVEPEEADPLRS
jgi:hypothetical protein